MMVVISKQDAIPTPLTNVRGKNHFAAYSPKVGRVVEFGTRLHYEHWVSIEADPQVTTFCERFPTIPVRLGRVDVDVPFSMWLRLANGQEQLCDVRMARELASLKTTDRTALVRSAQAAWCATHGASYLTLTDREIFAERVWLENWKEILRHLAPVFSGANQALQQTLLDRILAAGQVHLGGVAMLVPQVDPILARSALFALLHRGLLRADLTAERLSTSTLFELSHGA